MNDTTGLSNTAIGEKAMQSNITGTANTGVGSVTLPNGTGAAPLILHMAAQAMAYDSVC